MSQGVKRILAVNYQLMLSIKKLIDLSKNTRISDKVIWDFYNKSILNSIVRLMKTR